MAATQSCDLAIVGGGLAGGLIALAVATRRPDVRLRLIEGGETLGGNHLWSFFGSDVAREDRWLLDNLVTHAWPGYQVAFPGFERGLDQPYYSISADRFDRTLRDRLSPGTVLTGRKVLGVSATAAVLADGDRVEARGVIDARGAADLSWLMCGWQKFVGLEIETVAPHGLGRPIVMDGAVEQHDGFRFVYSLPFSPTRVFVEDTYYSDTRRIDRATLAARVSAYAAGRGWRVERVVREEGGALPVVMGGDFERYWASGGKGVAKAGARAGLFHPDYQLFAPRRRPAGDRDRQRARPGRRGAPRADPCARQGGVGRARLLPDAGQDAVPRRPPRRAVAGVGAVLPARSIADRAFLRRPVHDRRQGARADGPTSRAPGARIQGVDRMTVPKSTIVIGAGFGGLALAIRLQSAGVETTIVESRDKPGGRA